MGDAVKTNETCQPVIVFMNRKVTKNNKESDNLHITFSIIAFSAEPFSWPYEQEGRVMVTGVKVEPFNIVSTGHLGQEPRISPAFK